jgi:hypothetical protein
MSEGLDLGLESPTPVKAKLYKGKSEYAPPYYTINIPPHPMEGMPEFEVIGVNGEVIQVTRGVDVPNIPAAFINVLKQAVASKQVKHVNKDGSEYFEWIPYPAIPYQLVEGPYTERKEV